MVKREREYIGDEYSCVPIPWILKECQRSGVASEKVLEGVEYSLEHLHDTTKRIDYDAFHRIYSNMGKYLSDDELAEIGTTATHADGYRYLIALARILYSTREFYRWSVLEQFPKINRALTTQIIEPEPSRLLLELRMKPGYEMSREFVSLIRGQLSIFPVVFSQPRAEVKMELLEDGADYDIRYSDHNAPLSFLRKMLLWPFAVRTTARELRESHSLIQRRYHALENEIRARAKAEKAGARIREDEQTRIQLYLSGTLSRKMEEMESAVQALTDKLEPGYAVEHEMVETMDRACADTRQEIEDVVRALTTPGISAGLRDALQSMCGEMRAQSCVDIRFASALDEFDSHGVTGNHLFRIAQEAVTNALRHAAPSRIEVNVCRKDDALVLSIVDDGAGFSCSEPRYNCMGIEIMRRRAEIIGGSLHVESVVGEGTKVLCTAKAATGNDSRLEDASV